MNYTIGSEIAENYTAPPHPNNSRWGPHIACGDFALIMTVPSFPAEQQVSGGGTLNPFTSTYGKV